MKKSTLLATTLCAAAMGAIPVTGAMAGTPSSYAGSVGIMYSGLSVSGSSSNLSSWGGKGSVAFGLGVSNLGAQLDANYESISFSNGPSANNWGIGGSLFWSPTADGRVGATVAYDSLSSSGSGFFGGTNAIDYGVFGEWYAGDIFTFAAKFGGVSSSINGCSGSCGGASGSGWYSGAGVTAYAGADVALSGSFDYINITGGSQSTLGLGAEFLVSEQVPISVGGGFNYIHLSGGGSSTYVNAWHVAVKFYFNGDSSMSLRDRQRNGASTWASVAPQFYGIGG